MDEMVDGQLGNEIDGCGDDVEQFVCAQVNSILEIRYLKKKNSLKIYIGFIVWRRCKPTMHWMPHHLLLQQVSLSLYFNFLFIPFPLSFFSIPYIGYKCHSLHLLNLNDVLWFMEGLSPPLVPYDKFPYLFVR